MNLRCPNLNCWSFHIIKDGYYFRKNDSRLVRRYKCKTCFKKFSKSTFELECHQKKRRVNSILFKLLASGMSMRRCGLILGIHQTTVKRKFICLAKKANIMQEQILKTYKKNPVIHLQFDDLITIEHTKLKPLSVSVAVEAKSRIILGAEVSKIPAFGHLAKISQAKYGRRENDHKKGLDRLFKDLINFVHPRALIESDEHKTYPGFVRKYFPKSTHERHKGGRGCVTGQGELKKQHFDPIFTLNHTYAMLRENINRLTRKTWCTTKDPSMLKKHLDIYIAFHNSVLVA